MKSIRKWLNSTLAFLLVFALVMPAASQQAQAAETLADGLYDVPFTVLKKGTSEPSVMDGYTQKPAQVQVKDGAYVTDLTITNASWYKEFTIEGKAPEIVEELEADNKRVVRFTSNKETVDAWVHIVVTGIPGFNYDSQYEVDIAFDFAEAEIIELDQPETEEPGTEEPGTEEPGTEEPGTEEPGTEEPGTEEPETEEPGTEEPGTEEPGTEEPGTEEPGTEEPGTEEPGTEEPGTEEPGTEEPGTEEPGTEEPGTEEPGTEEPGTEEPGTEEPAPLEAGTYTIGFATKHATEDRDSSMSRYLVNPADLTVKAGKNTVELTVKDSHQITSLQLEQAGEFVEGEVVNENQAENTRTYAFEVADFSEAVQAKVSMRVALPNGSVYENTQAFRILFDLETVELVEAPEEEPETEEPAPLEDGLYTIGFATKHATEDRDSSMSRYIVNPADLTVKAGTNTVELTVKDSHQITSLQLEQADEFIEGEVVNENQDENTRTYAFEVADFSEAVQAKVSMRVALPNGSIYENTQAFRILFDLETLELVEVPEEPGTEEPGTEEPGTEEPGTEEPGIEEPGTEQPGTEQPGTEEPNNDELVNGKYEVDFSVLKKGTTDLSVMDQYTEKPASLFVKDGEITVDLTLLHDSWYKGFEINGETVETVSVNEEEDKRTVRFDIQDLADAVDLWVHISVEDIPGFEYDNQYDATLAFNLDSLILIEEDQVPPPTSGGEDPNGNDGNNGNNGNNNNGNNGNNGNNNNGNNNNGNNGGQPQELVNREYTIDFSVLKKGTTEVSVMDGYTKKPATVFVKGDNYTVDLTLTNSDWYKDFTVNGERPELVSENNETQERTVRFTTNSLAEKTNAWVHVEVTGIPGFTYNNAYDVEIVFDPASLELVEAEKTPPPAVPGDGNGSNNGGNNNQGNNDDNNNETPLSFDRNSGNGTGGTSAGTNAANNPQTFDSAAIGFYSALLILSIAFFGWKWSRRKKLASE